MNFYGLAAFQLHHFLDYDVVLRADLGMVNKDVLYKHDLKWLAVKVALLSKVSRTFVLYLHCSI